MAQVEELPEASVARHTIGVIPRGKELGVVVTCVMVITPEAVQLSVAVAAVRVTLVLDTLVQFGELTVISGPQTIVGAVPSVMVISQGTSVKLPAPSVARQVTVIIWPSDKVVGNAGEEDWIA